VNNASIIRVAKAQGADALTSHGLRRGHRLESILTQDRIVAQLLDVQETSVGCKGQLPQAREIVERLADAEVAGVVDNQLCPQRGAFLEVLLEEGAFVIQLQAGDHVVGDEPGAEAGLGVVRNATVKDQLHVLGASEVDVVAQHLLKEQPAGKRTIEHLRAGELGLPNKQLIPKAGGAILGRKRMRQAFGPFGHRARIFAGVRLSQIS
jgi:hypothetical protein